MNQGTTVTGSGTQSQSVIFYLGVSLSESGHTDTKLLNRLKQAQIGVKTLTTVLHHTAIDARSGRYSLSSASFRVPAPLRAAHSNSPISNSQDCSLIPHMP